MGQFFFITEDTAFEYYFLGNTYHPCMMKSTPLVTVAVIYINTHTHIVRAVQFHRNCFWLHVIVVLHVSYYAIRAENGGGFVKGYGG